MAQREVSWAGEGGRTFVKKPEVFRTFVGPYQPWYEVTGGQHWRLVLICCRGQEFFVVVLSALQLLQRYLLILVSVLFKKTTRSC